MRPPCPDLIQASVRRESPSASVSVGGQHLLLGLAEPADQSGADFHQNAGALARQAVEAVALQTEDLDVIERRDGRRAGLVVEQGHLAEEIAGGELREYPAAPLHDDIAGIDDPEPVAR